MKNFWRRVSPKRAVKDFADHWQNPTPHRWPILGLAVAVTLSMILLFVPGNEQIKPRRPEVIYISTWEEGRSEAEIIASNCRNQLLKDELEDKLAQRAELRRDIYRALGRATFIDVDEIDARIEAERAAEAAAAPETAPANPLAADPALSLEELCASVDA